MLIDLNGFGFDQFAVGTRTITITNYLEVLPNITLRLKLLGESLIKMSESNVPKFGCPSFTISEI